MRSTYSGLRPAPTPSLVAAAWLVLRLAVSAQPASPQPPASFPPGESIPVAAALHGGQIGRCADPHEIHSTIPLGTADVFGHGPYDLFVVPNRLYPFQQFDAAGTPLYGPPVTTRGPLVHEVFPGPDAAIYAVRATGKQVQVCRFDKQSLTFERIAESAPLDLPGSLGSGVAAGVSPDGRLHVYGTVGENTAYRPPGDPQAASFQPYDGAGFWRGGIPRRMLVHLCFDSIRLEQVIHAGRTGQGPGEFLFSVRALTVAHLGPSRGPTLVTSEKLGVLRCFRIDERTGTLGPQQLVNNPQHVALRHGAINPSAKAILDPVTGRSNLLVGEGGRLWFYRFSGTFTTDGAPVFQTPPTPVLAQQAPLTLANLPVISAGDLDSDGLIDLIAGNNAGDLLFVKNVGDASRPQFANPVRVPVGGQPLDIKAGYRGSIQGPGEAMWGYTCPTLCDWNGDGRLDVILNSILADYLFLPGLAAHDGPAFGPPQLLYGDGLQLHLAWRCQAAVTDWSTGQRLCLVALDEQNLLRMFWRVDNQNVERGELLLLQDGSPITANADESAGQTGRAKLVAHDWDADGDIDLLIGASRGLSFPAGERAYLPSYYGLTRQASVLLLRNVGTNAQPVFDYVKQVTFNGSRIKLGVHSCSPALVDLGRGVFDLLVGEEAGTVQYFPAASLSVSGPGE